MHDAFLVWLGEHTTLKTTNIVTAGGQIDSFLARVAAAALVTAAAAAGVQDVQPDEVDLPLLQ
eukprot:evm.model.NODE_17490_length_977_cov_8.940635.1